MNKVQMPKVILACLVVALVASTSVAVLALTSYNLVKPFTLQITASNCPLGVDAVNFAYVPETNTYSSVTLQVQNSGGSDTTATAYVYLKDSSGNIATGQVAQTFPAGASSVTVALTWTSGKTVADVTGGYIVLKP